MRLTATAGLKVLLHRRPFEAGAVGLFDVELRRAHGCLILLCIIIWSLRTHAVPLLFAYYYYLLVHSGLRVIQQI